MKSKKRLLILKVIKHKVKLLKLIKLNFQSTASETVIYLSYIQETT